MMDETMKLLRETIRRIILESENRNDWDGITDLIDTGKSENWRQAFSILETGIAQDFPEKGKEAIIVSILAELHQYEAIRGAEYHKAIDKLEKKQDSMLGLTPAEDKELGRLIKLSNGVVEEKYELLDLLAELVGIEKDTYFSWWFKDDLGIDDWENLFKKAGVI